MEIANNKPRIIFDSLKELEQIEMREEEKYISNLKLQREKIEEFRRELSKKTQHIKDLEAELLSWHSKKAEIDNFTSEMNYLTEELKESEIENAKLRATISSQVDEYDASIHELKKIVMKEREDKSREISHLKSEISEKDDDLETLMIALDKAKSTVHMLEIRYETEVKSVRDKENSTVEQIKAVKNSERALREEINSLRQENLAQKETLRLLNDKINKQSSLQEELEAVTLKLTEEGRKNKDIRRSYQEATEKYEILKRNIEKEFNELKDELNQAIEIISRQETSLQDLRARKQEDDARIVSLSKEIELKNQELYKIQKNSSKLTQRDEENADKISGMEFKIRNLLAENQQMKADLKKVFDKQEQEREERKKLAKKKLDLMTQRNEEITRLNQAFGTLDS